MGSFKFTGAPGMLWQAREQQLELMGRSSVCTERRIAVDGNENYDH